MSENMKNYNVQRWLWASILALLLIISIPLATLAQTDQDADSTKLEYRNYDEPIDPTLYLIRPGEKLLVTFVGTKLGSITLVVGPEGNIVDRNLGSISLAGRTLVEAREILTKPLKSQFNCDNLQITISDPYRVAISVTGAVANPGIYTGYTSHRVSEIIEKAGGVLATGSTRNIIFSGGPQELKVDLELAQLAAVNSSNFLLYAGRVIFVPFKSKQIIHLLGAKPRSIELLETDDLLSIKRLAGAAQMSDEYQLAILRETWQPAEAVDIKVGDIFKLKETVTDESLALFGEINRAGRYPYKQDMAMADLLSLGGGLTSAAQTDRMVIFRHAPQNEWGEVSDIRIPIKITASPADLQTKLIPSDSIVVSAATGFVEVVGFVRSPGFYPYLSGAAASDYIKLAGGFSKLAETELLIISDRLTGLSAQVSSDARPLDGDQLRIERKVSEQ